MPTACWTGRSYINTICCKLIRSSLRCARLPTLEIYIYINIEWFKRTTISRVVPARRLVGQSINRQYDNILFVIKTTNLFDVSICRTEEKELMKNRCWYFSILSKLGTIKYLPSPKSSFSSILTVYKTIKFWGKKMPYLFLYILLIILSLSPFISLLFMYSYSLAIII